MTSFRNCAIEDNVWEDCSFRNINYTHFSLPLPVVKADSAIMLAVVHVMTSHVMTVTSQEMTS